MTPNSSWKCSIFVGLVVAAAGCAPLNKALFVGLHPYANGMKALHAGRYDEAISNFNRIGPADPLYAETQYETGVARMRAGDEAGALKHLLTLRARDPVAFDTAWWDGDRNSSENMGSGGGQRLQTLGALYAKSVFVWAADAERNISQLYSSGAFLIVRAGHTLAVLAKADRALKWEKDVYSSSWVVPAFDATTVYVVGSPRPSQKPMLEALDLATGRVRWSKELNKHYERAVPGLDEKTVYIGDGKPQHEGTVFALDKATGAVRWSSKVEGYPGPLAVSATHVCTQGSTRIATCLDKATGKVTARQDLPELADGNAIAIDRARAFYSCGGATYAVNVTGGENALAWKSPRANTERKSSAPMVVGKAVLAQTGAGLLALDAETGARGWLAPSPESKRADVVGFGRPEKTDAAIVGWAESWAYAVDGEGKAQWALMLGKQGRPVSLSTSPVSDADGTIYVPTREGLWCFKPQPWAQVAVAVRP